MMDRSNSYQAAEFPKSSSNAGAAGRTDDVQEWDDGTRLLVLDALPFPAHIATSYSSPSTDTQMRGTLFKNITNGEYQYNPHEYEHVMCSLGPVFPDPKLQGQPNIVPEEPLNNMGLNFSSPGANFATPSPSSLLLHDSLPLVQPFEQQLAAAIHFRDIGTIYSTDNPGEYFFSCSAPCCGKNFTRHSDFERHYNGAHAPTKPEFWCPVETCDRTKGPRNRPFRRHDTMRDHYRTVHREKS